MAIIFKKVQNISEFSDAIRLRVDVFIIEQKFKPGWEPDEYDRMADHFIAVDAGTIIGTVRVRQLKKGEFKIERMAIAKSYREKNVGRRLLNFALEHVKKQNPKKIWLRSQVQAKEFYEKCGFVAKSKPFDMYGVQHIDLEYAK